MIVGTGLSHALCFEKKFEVAVVGKIPKGYLMHPNCDRKYYIDNVIHGANYTFKALPNISF